MPVGDPRDGFVRAVTGARRADGGVDERESGRIRLGTRFVINGRRPYSVADPIEAAGGTVSADEMIRIGDGPAIAFHWDLGDALPKPEDFVLACLFWIGSTRVPSPTTPRGHSRDTVVGGHFPRSIQNKPRAASIGSFPPTIADFRDDLIEPRIEGPERRSASASWSGIAVTIPSLRTVPAKPGSSFGTRIPLKRKSSRQSIRAASSKAPGSAYRADGGPNPAIHDGCDEGAHRRFVPVARIVPR